MIKLNCWEIKNCGREPGGRNAGYPGVCPAAADISSDGINGGRNAGRICWDVPHTLCEGKVLNDFFQKSISCVSCNVFNRVRAEEGTVSFRLLKIFHSTGRDNDAGTHGLSQYTLHLSGNAQDTVPVFLAHDFWIRGYVP